MADDQAIHDALAEKVELAIDGRLYSGWTEVSVTRALDSLSGSFSMALSAKQATDAAEFPIAAGDRCELRIGGETVINGWIDADGPSYDMDSRAITVSGRDLTCDLIDCSAIHKPSTWRNVKLEAIATDLAKPFGIKVAARASTGAAITKFALQQGETVFAALERLLRFRGLLMVSTVAGDVEIVTPDDGAPVTVLEQGVNIVSADGSRDHRERFSDYIVKGQAQGNDQHNGAAVSQIRGEARDPGVTRYRPMLIVAEDQSNRATATTRAQWEAGVRAGKARSCAITTLGWRTKPGGPLWKPNTRVQVKSPWAGISDEVMLVTAVTFSKSDAGTTTTVTVMPPEAWKQLAAPESKGERA